MSRMMKISVAAAAMSVVLSGCVVTGPSGPPTARGPSFAEGNWQQGTVASYVFGNGSFVGTATDTGNKVADGTYRYVNANTIQISSFSAVQQKTITANCLLVAGSTLNCTSDSGTQFSLARQTNFS